MPDQPMPLPSMFDLTERVCLVSGGAKGIGLAIASRLAEAGGQIAILDLDDTGGEQAASDLGAAGASVQFVQGDVSKPADVARVVERVEKLWGPVDILVNNAGIYPIIPTLACDETQWARVIDVNLKGVFLLARAAAGRMVETGRAGAIVNIASINAFRPLPGLAAYSSAKAGIAMLTRSLALEFGRFGIRVNSISPGGIETPGGRDANRAVADAFGITSEQVTAGYVSRVPLGRMGRADDVALVALFLVSPAAAYLTGTDVVVDGGYVLS
ncbi:SDR family NAD(P)-dependent oxidoreductase [Bradyrhizobium diazoefficiens]|uniref:SDR family NAD(P)-dependent oxidoreductase n=1 Tax=Bradyrhizobium diazoefficiens TaxID=1355477 RepID=UPI003599D2ED